MPGHAVHMIILDTVAEKLITSDDPEEREIGRILCDHREAAVTGCVGPDLFTWAREYPVSRLLIKFYENAGSAINEYERAMAGADRLMTRLAASDIVEPHSVGLRQPDDDGPGLAELEAGIGGLKKALSGLFAGIIDGFDPLSDPRTLPGLISSIYESTATREVSDQSQLSLGDLLHFHHSGDFAGNLLARSGDSEACKAYAYGYMTHVAADVAVHQFVRKAIGGPYSTAPAAHFVCEIVMDAAVYSYHFGNNLNGNMVAAMGIPEEMPEQLSELVSRAILDTYGNQRSRASSPEDVRTAYRALRCSYALTDGIKVRAAARPFRDVDHAYARAIECHCYQKGKAGGLPGIAAAVPAWPYGKSQDWKAETGAALGCLKGDLEGRFDEIGYLLGILGDGKCHLSGKEAAALVFGIEARLEHVMSAIKGIFPLFGIVLPDSTQLAAPFVKKLLNVTEGGQPAGPLYYISDRQFNPEQVKAFIDGRRGKSLLMADDDTDLGNAVDLAAWMISGTLKNDMEKYAFANWAMESEK